MLFRLNSTIYLDFTTHNPATGVVSDADSTPTAQVFEDDNDTSIYSPAVTKRVGQTGVYRLMLVAKTLNGFDIEKTYNVIVSATVSSKQAKSRVGVFQLMHKLFDDIKGFEEKHILSFDVKGKRIRVKRVGDT